MRRLALFLLTFAFGAWAFRLDSLPVWHDSLSHSGEPPEELEDSASDTLKLRTEGMKSVSVVVGDGGTEVDQELRLSMSGYVTDGVYVEALLSDVGRTAGDQSTATLQEVDEVYFLVDTKHAGLRLGDFTWKENDLGLFGAERASLGAMVTFRTERSEVSGAYGVDETERLTITFAGVDGQQTGYVLDANSSYLSLVPESETVYLNGKKLSRGTDYDINYSGGVLDFKGSVLPGSDDEVYVEYDAYNSGYASRMMAAQGSYRGKHLWLDVSGFRLENDVDRLKRSTWDSTDYALLKADDGSEFDRSDTLPELERPWRADRAAARLRGEFNNAYVDLESAYFRKDSNTVSSKVGGPEGRAFRWDLMTDSTATLRNFPLMFEVYGNYLEEGFDISEFQGTDRDWDSYLLLDSWDLDLERIEEGTKRHDEFRTNFRLGERVYGGSSLGYRQGAGGDEWNSLRSKSYLEYRGARSTSGISFVYVAAEDSLSSERYQGLWSSELTEGFFRPFASGDYAFWERTLEGDETETLRFKHGSGFALVGDRFNLREELGSNWTRTNEGGAFEDSLRQISWTQTASANYQFLRLEHLIQYKHSDVAASGEEDSWLSSQTARLGNQASGFEASVSYSFGLTEEQPYVAIYKAVASGTGDVMYDSATGLFIEGVDNGDYVYEGMGRSDSAEAVEASTAEFSLSFSWEPGRTFGISSGFVSDISLGLEYRSEGYDTTGRKVFFPPWTPEGVRELSSGLYYVEGDLGWTYPGGALTLHYYPGDEFEKKNVSQKYFQHEFWHRGEGVFTGRKQETWTLAGRYENVELRSVSDVDWLAYEGELSWRRELPLGFYIVPGAKVRYAEGDDSDEDFDALMKQGSLKIGYERPEKVEAYVLASAIQLDTDADYLPYQVMSGYDDGLTFRIEASAELSFGAFFSLSSRYIVRFGNAESGVFQKWSMEARAYL